jgi:glycosyltransferase involved in cell wall biosynthesis
MLQAYPEIAGKIALRPHPLHSAPPRLYPKPGARPVIGVLGNIGLHKGAGVLVALSRLIARSRDADLVILGQLDPAYNLARPARVHGAYTPDQIAALVDRYGITCWLIPSIWPETFSFTTHEAIATGLPVICFDLGGQGEALRRAINTASNAGALVALSDDTASMAPSVLAAVLTTVHKCKSTY